jgi:D-beta-D-heptose 7-phosphate kinase/D-beta-D-heptose 1-phosphate adenosyltransferase
MVLEQYNCKPEILIEAVRKFLRKKILVIGDVMLDRFIWGSVSRISPEAPVPVVEIRKETTCLGGAANVAANIKSLGQHRFRSELWDATLKGGACAKC